MGLDGNWPEGIKRPRIGCTARCTTLGTIATFSTASEVVNRCGTNSVQCMQETLIKWAVPRGTGTWYSPIYTTLRSRSSSGVYRTILSQGLVQWYKTMENESFSRGDAAPPTVGNLSV